MVNFILFNAIIFFIAPSSNSGIEITTQLTICGTTKCKLQK